MTFVLLMLTATALARAAWGFRSRRAAGVLAAAALVVAVTAGVGFSPGGYELRKLLGTLAMPIGLVWSALAVSAWWCAEHGRRRPAAVLLLLAVALWSAGNVFLGSALLGWLERPFDPVDAADVEPFDALLVLGGGLGADRRGDPTLNDASERVVWPAVLALEGRVRWLAASGPVVVTDDGLTWSGPRLTVELWRSLGLAQERLIAVEGPWSTSEEIAAYAGLVRERGWTRVGLVTSAWHMRRALRSCRRNGLDVVPVPVDFRAGGPHEGPRYLVPQASGAMSVQLAAWELLGMLVGR